MRRYLLDTTPLAAYLFGRPPAVALVAATALERGLTVVTTDGDYARVPGLSVLLLDRVTLAPVGGGTRTPIFRGPAFGGRSGGSRWVAVSEQRAV